MKRFVGVISFMVLIAPSIALAFPFGGQAYDVHPCYNSAILAKIGPPVAGWYIWTPNTTTYDFGPPRHAGQWLLGLAGPEYFCIKSKYPLQVENAPGIIMLGTSQ